MTKVSGWNATVTGSRKYFNRKEQPLTVTLSDVIVETLTVPLNICLMEIQVSFYWELHVRNLMVTSAGTHRQVRTPRPRAPRCKSNGEPAPVMSHTSHTQLQQAPGERHGLGQVPLLIHSVAQVVQDVDFIRRRYFSLIQLFQRLLHPELGVVVVGFSVGDLSQLKAIFGR